MLVKAPVILFLSYSKNPFRWKPVSNCPPRTPFFNKFKINSFSEMTGGQYQTALSLIEKKMQKLEAERKGDENENK